MGSSPKSSRLFGSVFKAGRTAGAALDGRCVGGCVGPLYSLLLIRLKWAACMHQPLSLKTAACGLLGCEVPILQAGMGGVARSQLVAAVVRAGGYGLLGMVRERPELIRREIHSVREHI